MVVALGPGRFYGSSLPRPRYFTDVTLNDERVDPPAPVLEPLLQWANDAHWSMGGLNFKRFRLQGRIEGNIEKLRKEQEKVIKKRSQSLSPSGKSIAVHGGGERRRFVVGDLPNSPPPAPAVRKRRRFMVEEDEEEGERVEEVMEESEEVVAGVGVGGKGKKRRLARKLGADFDLMADVAGATEKKSPLADVANLVSETIAITTRTRSQMSPAGTDKPVAGGGSRGSMLRDGGKKTWEHNSGLRKGNKNGGEKKGVSESASITASPNGTRRSPRLVKA